MSLVIFLGVLAPVLFLMVKVVSNTLINKKIILYTVIIAMIGMSLTITITAKITQLSHLFTYLVASCVVGAIWGITLCGCYYYYYQKLSNAFKNKNNGM